MLKTEEHEKQERIREMISIKLFLINLKIDDDNRENDGKNLEQIQQKCKKREDEFKNDLRKRNTHRSRISEVK